MDMLVNQLRMLKICDIGSAVPPQSHLLALPAELRNQIWVYVVTPDIGHIDLRHPQGKPNLDIAFINRQTSQEVLYVLYDSVPFHAETWDYECRAKGVSSLDMLFLRSRELPLISLPPNHKDKEAVDRFQKAWAAYERSRDNAFMEFEREMALNERSHAVGLDPSFVARFRNVAITTELGPHVFFSPYREGGGPEIPYCQDIQLISNWQILERWLIQFAKSVGEKMATCPQQRHIQLRWYWQGTHLKDYSPGARLACIPERIVKHCLKRGVRDWRAAAEGTSNLISKMEGQMGDQASRVSIISNHELSMGRGVLFEKLSESDGVFDGEYTICGLGGPWTGGKFRFIKDILVSLTLDRQG